MSITKTKGLGNIKYVEIRTQDVTEFVYPREARKGFECRNCEAKETTIADIKGKMKLWMQLAYNLLGM